jgi:hypothetical protein
VNCLVGWKHNLLPDTYMKNIFHLQIRTYYPLIFFILFVVFNALAFCLGNLSNKPSEFFFPATTLVTGFCYFLYSQHIQQTKLFIDLFTAFNSRYDKLNKPLNMMLVRGDGNTLRPEDVNVLYDYFNLCAEEYLYYKSGYIDSNVWESWTQGMKIFTNDDEIKRLWVHEIQSGSYYGFSLDKIAES